MLDFAEIPLRVVGAESQQINGQWVEGSHLQGVPTVQTVVNACIQAVYDLENSVLSNEVSEHRHLKLGVQHRVQTERYAAHCIISVRSNKEAEDVAAYVNAVFENARSRYPRDRGWRAVVSHHKTAQQISDPDHPFFYAVRNGGGVSGRAARFLIVKDQAREGLNNRYVAVWGCAADINSQIEAIQRFGRVMRSAHYDEVQPDGSIVRHVPSRELDVVRVITHEQFSRAIDTIADAIDFLRTMNTHIEDATALTIDEYVQSEDTQVLDDDHSVGAALTLMDRLQMMVHVGNAKHSGRRIRWTPFATSVAGQNARRQRRSLVTAYGHSLYYGEPQSWQRPIAGELLAEDIDGNADFGRFMETQLPDPLMILLQAEVRRIKELSPSECSDWVNSLRWGEQSFGRLRDQMPESGWVRLVNDAYRDYSLANDAVDYEINEPPSSVVERRIDQLVAVLDKFTDTRGKRETVGNLAWRYVEHYLSAPQLGLIDDQHRRFERDEFMENGRYHRSDITDVMRNDARMGEQLTLWVFKQLVLAGEIPGLSWEE